jgi:hypothetical protein
MARKTTAKSTTATLPFVYDERARSASARAWDDDDEEAEIRFSLTALGEAVVSDRDGRRPKFRGFGPCGRVVA